MMIVIFMFVVLSLISITLYFLLKRCGVKYSMLISILIYMALTYLGLRTLIYFHDKAPLGSVEVTRGEIESWNTTSDSKVNVKKR